MKLLKLIILLFLPSIIFAQTHQLIDGVAAVVGDKIVLLSDVNLTLNQYAMQNKIDLTKDKKTAEVLRENILNSLIDQKVLLVKAEEDTIKVDDEQVENNLESQLDYMMKQAGSKEKLVEYYDMTLSQIKNKFRKDIKEKMIVQELQRIKLSTLKLSRVQIESFFANYKDSLPERGETVDISHILLTPQPSDSATKLAYMKIQKIKEMISAKKSFEELAKEYSQDPGSAAQNGSLGWAERGSFVPEFEEAAFNLEKGEISDIVQSQFGFHIIKLLDRQGEKIKTAHILIKLQITDEDKRQTAIKLNGIREQIMNGELSFEEAAIKNSEDPNVKKDKGHLGEFVMSEFKIQEFAKTVKKLKIGDISYPISTEFGIHILKLNSSTPARKLNLQDDWDNINKIAMQFEQQKIYKEWVAELKNKYPIEIKTQE